MEKISPIKINLPSQDPPNPYERAEAVSAIQLGIAEFDRGEGRPAREALDDLKAKQAIPR